MNNLLVILSTIFLSVIGFIFIKGCNLLPDKKNIYIFGLSYGIGVGLISQQLFLLNLFSIGWNINTIILFWLTILLVFLILKRKRFKIKFEINKFEKFSLLLLVSISAQVLYTFIESIIRPLSTWDGWAIWLNKSKFFFVEGKIDGSSLLYIHSPYPLTLSLLGLFDYLLLKNVNDTSVLISFFSFYFFLVILFFSALKEKFSLNYSLFFTFLFVAIQNFTRHGGRFEVGQADLALGYYIFSCSLLLIDYFNNKKNKTLILLCFFLGITGLIKVEGMIFVLSCLPLIIFNIIKNHKIKNLILLLIVISPIACWEFFKINNKISSLPVDSALSFNFQKTISIIFSFVKEILNIKTWNLLWIVYIFSLIFIYTYKSKEIILLNYLILSQVFLYVLIYLFINIYEPASSLQRLLLHVAPISIYSITLFCSRLKIAKRLTW